MNNSAPRILFVDNEPRTLRSLRAAYRHKYHLTLAQDGEEAQALLQQAAEPFDVIVSDQNMPNSKGHELLNWSRQNHPNSSRILLSGSDKVSLEKEAAEADIFKFITKPWDVDGFSEVLDQAVDHAAQLKSGKIDSDISKSLMPDDNCTVLVLDACRKYDDIYSKLAANVESISTLSFSARTNDIFQRLEQEKNIGIIVVDLSLDEGDVFSLLQKIHKYYPEKSLIVTAQPSQGAKIIPWVTKDMFFQYIIKPMSEQRLGTMLEKAASSYLVALASTREKTGKSK